MGKQRRGRDGSANQGGGARTPQGGHAGKGNRAAEVYAGGRPGRAGLQQGNAIIVVVARKGGREIERWEGNMNWPEELGELPVAFAGRRAGDEWIWSDERADSVCLLSATPDVCGVEIKPWAYQRGATELLIRIVANPGTKAAEADAQGPGTQGQGTGMDARDRALAGMYSDMLSPAARAAGSAASAGDASRSVDGSFRDVFADMLGHRAHEAGREDGSSERVGLGEQGAGAAQGTGGERAVTGRGQDTGKPAGAQEGGLSPSWYTRAGAAADNEWGGRTPDLEHGKPEGSAGGQQGGEGHLLGMWNGPIDVAAGVAIAVNAAIVLLDADVKGLGERFLGKVVGGLAGKQLRKELAREATRVIDGLMPKVEKELAGDAGYRAMRQAGKDAAQAQPRQRLEREYYSRARAYFASQAERCEAIVQRHADDAGELAAHERDIAAANARAYRELEQAAAQNGGLAIEHRTDAAASALGRENARPAWSAHGGKHVATTRVPWTKIVEGTKSGPAKYLPGTNIEALERQVWAEGTAVTSGRSWKTMEFPDEIGASGGKPSRWVRVEESGGTIHGHPITEAEFHKLTRPQ